jgi:DeoR family transcriptional regulator, suf operon transcriptional repressor
VAIIPYYFGRTLPVWKQNVKIVTINGKQSTRDIILQAIKSSHQASVEELAEAANVSPVTVRHHLNSLQADGLLVLKSIRRKVGRPHYVYSLSERGHELFPQKYVRLSSRLLDELKTQFPAEIVGALFSGVAQRMVHDHQEDLESLPTLEDRLDYLVKMLAEEGFLAEWQRVGNQYRLIEYSCPYISVGQKHSEVCQFDQELILSVLGSDFTKDSCMLQGDPCCQFTVLADSSRG